MHFEGSFYTPPGGMELFTPYLQKFQRTQNHRPLEPENHGSFSGDYAFFDPPASFEKGVSYLLVNRRDGAYK